MLARTTAILLLLLCAAPAAHTAFWDVEPVHEDWFLSGDASLSVSPANVLRSAIPPAAGFALPTRRSDVDVRECGHRWIRRRVGIPQFQLAGATLRRVYRRDR